MGIACHGPRGGQMNRADIFRGRGVDGGAGGNHVKCQGVCLRSIGDEAIT
jgi:hypothetical protein